MNNICQECGMVCRTPTEYHPYAACLMFKACHDGDKVRANLQAVRADAAEADQADILAAAVQQVDEYARIINKLRAMVEAAEAGQEAAAVQAVGAAPLFWYRPCGDNLYEGPFHTNSTEGKQLREEKPDAWHPLYTAAVGAWRDVATAPEGVLVIVGWREEEDSENPDRHMFDYLEDGVWANYFSEHEHYSIAGVAHGLSEDAPYTHWMPMGAIPGGSLGDGGGKG